MTPIFSNKTYDILKWMAMVALPAFTVLFQTIGLQLGFELTETITAILVAVNGFIGALLGLSTAQYNDNK